MFSWVDSGLSEKQGLFLILLSFMSPVSLSTGLTQRWHARRICWAELIWKETVISTVRYCRKVQQTRAWNASGAFDPQEVPDDLSKSSCWSLLLVEAIIQAAEALMVGKNWRPFITLSSGEKWDSSEELKERNSFLFLEEGKIRHSCCYVRLGWSPREEESLKL